MSPAARALAGGLIWVAVGIMLVVRGIMPHWFNARDLSESGAWIALACGVVIGGAKGFFVLRKAAGRMVDRIRAHGGPAPFWQIYPPRFLLLIPLMIGLGFAIRHFFAADHPGVVTAVYVGIGAALFASSLPFFKAAGELKAQTSST